MCRDYWITNNGISENVRSNVTWLLFSVENYNDSRHDGGGQKTSEEKMRIVRICRTDIAVTGSVNTSAQRQPRGLLVGAAPEADTPG